MKLKEVILCPIRGLLERRTRNPYLEPFEVKRTSPGFTRSGLGWMILTVGAWMPIELNYDQFEFGDSSLMEEPEICQLSKKQRKPTNLTDMINTLERNPRIRWMVKSAQIKHKNGRKAYRVYALFRDKRF